MKKTRNAIRLFLLWARRWLRTAKPTEWITALTTFLGVVATIVAGFMYLSTGVLDTRRSELDAKRTELNIQLLRQQDDERQISERETGLRERKAILAEQEKKHNVALAMFRGLVSEFQSDITRARRTFELRNPNTGPLNVEFDRDITKEDFDNEATLSAKIKAPPAIAAAGGDSIQLHILRSVSAEETAKGVTIPVKVSRVKRSAE